MQHSSAFLSLVNDVKTHIIEVNIHEVKQWLDDGHSFILIDTREESEWNSTHISQAVHLGKGIIERDIEALYADKDTPLVLYCGGGFRSVLAADNLQKMGYRKVMSMSGGIRQWKDAGYPLAK